MKKLLLSVATTALFATGALAADLSSTPTTYDTAAFDWNGFYVGVHGVYEIDSLSATYYGAGVNAGFNVQEGDWVFGADLGVALWDDSSIWADFTARAGYLVDPSVLLFASAGGGLDLTGTVTYFKAGAGAEFAVTDNISFVGTYEHLWYSTATTAHDFKAGINFHFD